MLDRASVRWLLLVLTAIFLLASSLFAGFYNGSYGHWVYTIGATTAVASVLTLLTAYAWRNKHPNKVWLFAVLAVAVLFRLCVFPASRDLSDDAYRYLWDGKVLASGINPFLHSPDSPELSSITQHLADDRINHPWNRTCYPPVAQLIFTTGYRLSPGSLLGFQILCLLSEMAAWLLLVRALNQRQLSVSWILFIAWSPLLIFQGYLPGHVDLLYLPWVVLFISCVSKGQAKRAGVVLAVACLIKPLPLLLLPAALCQLKWKKAFSLAAVLAAVYLLFYIPFLGAGERLFESTLLMVREWKFNASVAQLLDMFLPQVVVRRLLGVLTICLLGLSVWRGRDMLERMLLAIVAFVIASPIIFPWYLVVAIPLLVIRQNLALLALVTTVCLSDEVIVLYHQTGVWEPRLWPQLVEYGLFYSVLIWTILRPGQNPEHRSLRS